jgi:hypothetical protein
MRSLAQISPSGAGFEARRTANANVIAYILKRFSTAFVSSARA